MKAVILAGGLGNRLRPFTQVIPKPILPVGESSVLEIQILSLKKSGFEDIYIATNYLAEYVQAFLGDGSKQGVRLNFSKEDKPLGTCGPVLLLRETLTEPFILMNGDILTTLQFDKLYDFGSRVDAELIVVTKEIVTPFSFGRVTCEGDYILHIEEKPDLRFEILAGIYMMKPSVLDLIPPDTYFGIDSLIKKMLSARSKVARYLTKEYWLDIGEVTSYEKAQSVYDNHFKHLKSDGEK
jgi:NDP-mannose synthase